jgi:glycerol-3-phosphate dehydrogenase (NAD(P)+)
MGAGMWGTTFAQVLCDAGTPVRLWGRRPDLVATMNARHENPDYLPGITLPAELTASADAGQVLDQADLVVLAVPAQTLRHHLTAWRDLLPAGAAFVSLMKGIELGTHERMSQVIADVTGAGPDRIAVISGPNLAREIAERQHAATVVACADDTLAKRLQQDCHTPYFRPYTNPDVIGCELGGAVKNVIALGIGIAVGMGTGDNTRATLITRGLAEITRLGAALGADQHTFAGLAGLGDLGMAVADVAAVSTQVAEGAKSAGPILELARSHAVEMPITEVVVGVMHGQIALSQAAMLLTSRSAKPERYGV